ncbi:MAG: protein-L-isoaspartate(D-aspartate) O-methyltransferase [bacterium]|nr:protein-L-isoaspartate(D-aspartate) O-methyltransferase [bacterium]
MVDDQVKKRGVKQPSVLSALEMVPRHLFVPEPNQPRAYQDAPVAFAPGQNLSHPFVSARMIEVLELKGKERVLEIGTGSGYDAALLSRVAGQVYTIEIDKSLAARARRTLRKLGFDNVEVKSGDGYRGWPEKAPFDAILVTVSTREPPPMLYDQLKMGGRMVVAVGSLVQEMQLITKTTEGPVTEPVSLVNLGPMTGEVNRREQR